MTRFGLAFLLLTLVKVQVSGQESSQFNCSQKLLFKPIDVKLCCKLPVFRLDRFRDQCFSKTFTGGSLGRNNDDTNYFMNPCVVECVMKRAGALENNHLNMSNMNALIRSYIPNNPELIQIFHSGFEKCGEEILSTLKEFEKNRQAMSKIKSHRGYQGLEIPCSPFAVLASYCALKHAFLNCPQSSWVNTEVCDNARNYVQKCEPDKFGGPRQRKRHRGKLETGVAKINNSGAII